MKYLLAIIIAAAAMIESIWYRHKHREEAEQYASTTKLISGIGFIIAVAGIIINECGVRGGAYILIFGLILSFAVCIPALKKDGDVYYILLGDGRFSKGQLRCIHPLYIWFGHAMGGMGMLSKTLLCFTVVGIPIVKSIENSVDTIDYIGEQQQLRSEAEALELESITLEVNKSIRRGN